MTGNDKNFLTSWSGLLSGEWKFTESTQMKYEGDTCRYQVVGWLVFLCSKVCEANNTCNFYHIALKLDEHDQNQM